MRATMLVSVLLASAICVPAFGQSSPPTAPASPDAMVTTAPTAAGPQWRASKLVGVDVYNDQDEKLGDVDEVLQGVRNRDRGRRVRLCSEPRLCAGVFLHQRRPSALIRLRTDGGSEGGPERIVADGNAPQKLVKRARIQDAGLPPASLDECRTG